MHTKRLVGKALRLLFVVMIVSGLAASAALAQPAIEPPEVTALMYPGDELVIDKTVTTPEIPPKPDIYFLTDSTGSMNTAIANVQANAAAILGLVSSPLTQFGAGQYKDFFAGNPFAFQNDAPIGSEAAAAMRL